MSDKRAPKTKRRHHLEGAVERKRMASMATGVNIDRSTILSQLKALGKLGKGIEEITGEHRILIVEASAMIEANALSAGLEKFTKDQILRGIGRRKHSHGQSIKQLAMQQKFGLSKATANRYVTIIRFAVLEGHRIDEMKGFVEKHGGWDKTWKKAYQRISGGPVRQEREMRLYLSKDVRRKLPVLVNEKDQFLFFGVAKKTGTSMIVEFINVNILARDVAILAKLGRLKVGSAGDISLVPTINLS